MLVLSRKKHETIIVVVPPSDVPRRISIAVVEIRGDKVRIGTDADKDVSVHRAEIQSIVDAKAARAAEGGV